MGVLMESTLHTYIRNCLSSGLDPLAVTVRCSLVRLRMIGVDKCLGGGYLAIAFLEEEEEVAVGGGSL